MIRSTKIIVASYGALCACLVAVLAEKVKEGAALMALTAKQRHHRLEAKRARRRRDATRDGHGGRLMARIDKARIGQDEAWPWLLSAARDQHEAEVDRATRRLQRAKRLVLRS